MVSGCNMLKRGRFYSSLFSLRAQLCAEKFEQESQTFPEVSTNMLLLQAFFSKKFWHKDNPKALSSWVLLVGSNAFHFPASEHFANMGGSLTTHP